MTLKSFVTSAGKKVYERNVRAGQRANYTICYFSIGTNMMDKFYKMISQITNTAAEEAAR